MVRPSPLTFEVTFPEGAIVQPRTPRAPRARDKVCCPYCGTDDVKQTAKRGDPDHEDVTAVVYYRCNVCVDPETCDLSRFKRVIRRSPPVPREEPPTAL